MGLNSPPPQDDLTAERAADLIQSVFLANEKQWRAWYALANSGSAQQSAPDGVAQKLVDAVAAAIKTVRQEALREARDYALACVAERDKQAFELTKTVLNDPRAVWLGCKASEAERIAEWLDRLASEGG